MFFRFVGFGSASAPPPAWIGKIDQQRNGVHLPFLRFLRLGWSERRFWTDGLRSRSTGGLFIREKYSVIKAGPSDRSNRHDPHAPRDLQLLSRDDVVLLELLC